MSLRRGPRLGLVARLGFVGALGVGIVAGASALDWRAAPASDGSAVAAQAPQTRPAQTIEARRGVDSIEALLAADGSPMPVAETTGSVAPSEPLPQSIGPVSRLPLPRFVSIKADKVNVRRGPSRDHDVAWVFQRAGLPVEITAEFSNWRRIRDSDGSEGWVLHSMLSGRRTALVAPWSSETVLVHRQADEASPTVARLESGVLAAIKGCDGAWCRLDGDRFDGWVRQSQIWGAYPGENVED